VNVPRRKPLPAKQLGNGSGKFDHVPILAASASRSRVSLQREDRETTRKRQGNGQETALKQEIKSRAANRARVRTSAGWRKVEIAARLSAPSYSVILIFF